MAGVSCCCVAPLSCVAPVLFIVFPVFELDPVPCVVQFPLHCVPSCCVVRFFFVLLCCCVVVLLCCCVVCGEREGGVCGLIVNVVFLSFSPSVFVFAVTALLV